MELVINDTKINTDGSGRFSLNDLHRAAGSNVKHLPAKFYRSHGFSEEVDFLMSRCGQFEPIVKKQGKFGGTWVCKELVYSYAMWINPEFKMKVIQTFDQVMKSSNPPATMEALNELTKKIESDKDLASKCGHLLAHYKKVKKENEESWLESVREAQLTLGFVK